MSLALALSATGSKGRILLVEDDSSQARLVSAWLAGDDYEVVVADSNEEARATVGRDDWDAIIMDVALPDGSGLELIDIAKSDSGGVPVIMMTAHGRVEFVIDALRRGADDYLRKPLNRHELLGSVARVIESARQNTPVKKRVLAIGVAPGDVESGCAGTLLRHRQQGDAVYVVIATGGEQLGNRSTLQAELVNAGLKMDARVIVEALPQGSLSNRNTELVQLLGRLVESLDISVVYAPSQHDELPDVRALHHSAMVATRGVGEVYCYQALTSTPAFSPNRFEDVSEVFPGKLEVLQAYKSLWGGTRLDGDGVRASARYWGRFAGGRLVEPLELIREVRESSS